MQWLTRWVHRNLPRCFAPRNAKRYAKQRGSLLWTTGTTPQHRVPHNVKWTSFAPPGWTNFAPPLTRARATEPNEAPIPITGYLKDGDEIHIVAVSELKNYNYVDGVEITTPTGALLIVTQRLDEDFLADISESYLLGGIQLLPAGASVDRDVKLPLVAADGNPIGYLAWEVSSPGQAMLKQMLPGIGAAFLVLAGLAYLLLNRGQNLVEATLSEMAIRRRTEAQLVQFQKIQSLGNSPAAWPTT